MSKERGWKGATLRTLGAVQVGCTLTNRLALARVASATQREHACTVPLTRNEALDAAARGTVAGLVYEMEPGDRSVVDFVRQVHAARQDWPVWLYCAPRPGMTERVADVASLRGVWATLQGTGPLYEEEIRVHVRRLVTSVPRVRLVHLLDGILRPLPVAVQQFLEASLEHRDRAGPRAFRVRDGATILPNTLRHLELVCHAATGLGPKRLLDRLILVFVTFKSFAFDVPPAAAAEQAGLSPKALYRLRHGILGAGIPWQKEQPRAQFALALMALAEACRAPQQVAEEVVEHVARERRA